jgi:hypothetical protein
MMNLRWVDRRCSNCSLLKISYNSQGRAVYNCVKRADAIPDAFVWSEEPCPLFEA